MADPKDFQFSIVGVDESAPAWDSATSRAGKGNAALQKGADRTHSKLQKVLGPARELAPALDKGLKQMERISRVGGAVTRSFKPSGAARNNPVQAATEIARAQMSGTTAKLANAVARSGGGSVVGAAENMAMQAGRAVLGRGGVGGSAAVGAAEMAAAGEGAAAGLGAAETGLAGVATEGAAAGIALGGVATGIGALVVAAVAGKGMLTVAEAKFASTYARSAQEILRTSDLLGMDSDKLQRWRGAAERSGLDPHAADTAVGDIGMALHNLSYGQGDPVQANLLRRLGVAIPKPGEDVDPDAVLKQIADKLSQVKNPYTRANMANRLGVSSLLPMLDKGSGAIEASMAAYDKSGAAFTHEQVKKGSDYAVDLTDFKQAGQGLGKRAAMLAMDDSRSTVRGTTQAENKLGQAADQASGSLMQFAKQAAEVLLGGSAQAADMDHAQPLPGKPGRPGQPGKPGEAGRGGQGGAAGDAGRGGAGGEPGTPGRPGEAGRGGKPGAPGAAASTPPVHIEDPRLAPALRPEHSLADDLGGFLADLFRHPGPKAVKPPPPIKEPPPPGEPWKGVRPDVQAAIEAASDYFGLDRGLMRKVAERESQFDPSARPWNPRKHKFDTSAVGLYQFLDDTWLGTMKKHGHELGFGKEAESIVQRGRRFIVRGGPQARKALLGLRYDPHINAFMGAAYTSDNAEYLEQRTGHKATGGELYAAHFLGPQGAAKFTSDLAADPNGDASGYFPKEAAKNQGVFYGAHGRHKSLEEVMQGFEATGGSPEPATVSGTVDVNVNIHGGREHKVTVEGSGQVNVKTYRSH